MKNYFLLLTVASFAAHGGVRSISRVVKDATSFETLELSPQTVFCTALGYSSVQLKVNVPELDYLAHFDHRVVGEGQPCMAAGECTATLAPGSIITNEKYEVVPVRVILTENLSIDDDHKTCGRTLSEKVVSHIRGHDFFHYKASDSIENVAYDKCVKVQNL